MQALQKLVAMLGRPGAEFYVCSLFVFKRIDLSLHSARFRTVDASGEKWILVVSVITAIVEVIGKLFPTTVYIAKRLGDNPGYTRHCCSERGSFSSEQP